MRESPDLTAITAYLVLLLVASTAAEVDEDDYLYTNFFPELLNQPSELDTTGVDPDEIHELLCVDCKAVPKLATVRNDDSLLLKSTQRADQRLGQTTVVKKRGGVPWPYFNRRHFIALSTSY